MSLPTRLDVINNETKHVPEPDEEPTTFYLAMTFIALLVLILFAIAVAAIVIIDGLKNIKF